MKKISLLLSTANERINQIDSSLIKKYENVELIIVHQIYIDNKEKSNYYSQEKVFIRNEKGLSKSRNIALAYAEDNICLLCDDDIKLVKNFDNIIFDAYRENPEADVICFQAIDEDGIKFKNYHSKKRWLNIMTLMKVSSIEITFKSMSIQNTNIKFDEEFGLGTEMPTGEESIFLVDAYKKNLKILYVPIPIVIHPLESSGTEWNNEKMIKAKGAMFGRMFGKFGYFFNLLFSLKKYSLYKKEHSFVVFFGMMNDGLSNFLKSSKLSI
jgi:glycosyltransferase involved in cell wall biosynthesis